MASIFSLIGDSIYDYVASGYSSSEDYAKAVEEAEAKYQEAIKAYQEQYEAAVEEAEANRKSTDELYQEAKETAAAEASNKAGLARKEAKAAAMQTSGSKLLAAIQGAQAANDAVQEGYSDATSNYTNLGKSINEASVNSALNAAQNAYSTNTAAAEQELAADKAAATTIKNSADAANQRKSTLVNAIIGGFSK